MPAPSSAWTEEQSLDTPECSPGAVDPALALSNMPLRVCGLCAKLEVQLWRDLGEP